MQTSHSENKSSTLSEIGDRLKGAREAKGLTIDQVNKKLRIHSSVLKALESGRVDEMLNVAYSKSFLKEYATFLGLDAKEIVRAYLALHSSEPKRPETELRMPSNAPEAKDDQFSGAAKFLGPLILNILVGILIVAIIFFLGRATIGFVSGIFKKKPAVTQKSNKAKTVKKSAAEKPKARPKAAKKAAARSEKKDTDRSKASGDIVPNGTPLKLVIRVRQPVLIQVKADGVMLFKYVLESGVEESFTAKDTFSLYLSKAEAVDLTLNGKPLKLSAKGIVKEISITRKGLSLK